MVESVIPRSTETTGSPAPPTRDLKVIIQIPCYNEEDSLPISLADLPRTVHGAQVEWLVIDDGSQDETIRVAKENGVDHIVEGGRNRGLAWAFLAGLDECLRLGADIIVNTDADNQYCADDIPKLLEPILAGEAEIVIGERPIEQIEHFSPVKKLLQRFGSWVVRKASGTDVRDAPSGFRAMTRDAAEQLYVFNDYTYTLETIIQAGQRNIPITSVPIRTNPDLRPSRLVRSIRSYVARSMGTILRIATIYRPLRSFFIAGSIPLTLGMALCVRWLVLHFSEPERVRAPSLILATILILVGVQLISLGVVADLLSANRRLLEDLRIRQRRDSNR